MMAPAGNRPVRFGVNYTPRVGWFHHWLDFCADEVARDLDTIAESVCRTGRCVIVQEAPRTAGFGAASGNANSSAERKR